MANGEIGYEQVLLRGPSLRLNDSAFEQYFWVFWISSNFKIVILTKKNTFHPYNVKRVASSLPWPLLFVFAFCLSFLFFFVFLFSLFFPPHFLRRLKRSNAISRGEKRKWNGGALKNWQTEGQIGTQEKNVPYRCEYQWGHARVHGDNEKDEGAEGGKDRKYFNSLKISKISMIIMIFVWGN